MFDIELGFNLCFNVMLTRGLVLNLEFDIVN